ncbi:hypothetical protein NDU88_003635 [Pleurodeles waltl]|uniref:Uncharacterized protein n=1 Tax=Pleurodeles waltl TaxID=8319 RepID=A0AAV7SGI7_PLEWA|nr:hypothetical protein NDU88_003635 [Pleurodeles waltl]
MSSRFPTLFALGKLSSELRPHRPPDSAAATSCRPARCRDQRPGRSPADRCVGPAVRAALSRTPAQGCLVPSLPLRFSDSASGDQFNLSEALPHLFISPHQGPGSSSFTPHLVSGTLGPLDHHLWARRDWMNYSKISHADLRFFPVG